MTEQIKYIHGSEDSTDVDVFYVFDELPAKEECKKFCSEDPEENRNIIVIKNGVVTACYKGTPDEVNNALLRTYKLHPQTCPLLVERPVQRDVTVKIIRAVRIILSHISHSQYRAKVKHALSGTFAEKLEALRTIDFETIDFSGLNKKMSAEDVLKTIAFQIGQTLDLIYYQAEVYTKSEVAEHFPSLAPFLHREEYADVQVLEQYKNMLIAHIKERVKYEGYNIEKYDSFKAGAEWMAGQGVTEVSRLYRDPNPPHEGLFFGVLPFFSTIEMALNHQDGEEVIVQIRKKQ